MQSSSWFGKCSLSVTSPFDEYNPLRLYSSHGMVIIIIIFLFYCYYCGYIADSWCSWLDGLAHHISMSCAKVTITAAITMTKLLSVSYPYHCTHPYSLYTIKVFSTVIPSDSQSCDISNIVDWIINSHPCTFANVNLFAFV